MVKKIEELGAELEVELFGQNELAADRKIYLPGAKLSHGIAPQVSLLTGRWTHERVFIEHSPCWDSRVGNPDGLPGNQIGP